MFRNLGLLVVVVSLTIWVSLGLSRGILAAVVKAISFRSSSCCFMDNRTRLVPSSHAKAPVESIRLSGAGRIAQRSVAEEKMTHDREH